MSPKSKSTTFYLFTLVSFLPCWSLRIYGEKYFTLSLSHFHPRLYTSLSIEMTWSFCRANFQCAGERERERERGKSSPAAAAAAVAQCWFLWLVPCALCLVPSLAVLSTWANLFKGPLSLSLLAVCPLFLSFFLSSCFQDSLK